MIGCTRTEPYVVSHGSASLSLTGSHDENGSRGHLRSSSSARLDDDFWESWFERTAVFEELSVGFPVCPWAAGRRRARDGGRFRPADPPSRFRQSSCRGPNRQRHRSPEECRLLTFALGHHGGTTG